MREVRDVLEGTLVEKLRKLEALHAGTKIDGEREAARRAAERIRARLDELRRHETDVEMLYRIPDAWNRKLFTALCRRYGLRPYRERGRRTTTLQVRAPQTFHDRTLWPEFLALSKELEVELDKLTDKVIREAIHEDVTEAPEAAETKALPSPARTADQAPSTGAPAEESSAGSPR
jgi:hypothetical protein